MSVNATTEAAPIQAGWRVRLWCHKVPCSPAFFYKQLKTDEELRRNTIKVGRMTIIRESPEAYLESVREH
jgi:hypothetical protein